MNKKYQEIFKPFTFPSGLTIDNRVAMAPMTTQSSFENGMVTTDEHIYYDRRSKNVGLVITSCAQVKENGKFPGSLSVADDKHIHSLTKLATTIKKNGAKAILQIFHVGRMGESSVLGEQPVSASAVPALRDDAETPRELENKEVYELVDFFGEATRRAIEAGFDGVEIHGANTYLIQQFFSPHSNRRKDEWGGSVEKRMKFPLDIVDTVKATVEKHATKPFLVGYRISPEELENPGITLEDTLQLLDKLAEKNLDYLHISVGHYKQTSIRDKSQETPLLKVIQSHLGDKVPLMGVGLIKTPQDALDALEIGVPLLALGRELIVEPDWMKKVKNGDEHLIRTEISANDYQDLALPDSMWEYVQSRPNWLPFKNEEEGV